MTSPLISPQDEYNDALVANVHPLDWKNPEPRPGRYNLVVIGAGTAGLVTAAGAAGLGAKVALIERHLMGGDCLNVGCVPSKVLLRSAHLAAEIRDAGELGVRVPEGTRVDFGAVMERMRRLRSRISAVDSARRFRDDLGVDVFIGDAHFSSADTVEVGGAQLRFRKAVIAAGARPTVPELPGLAEAGYYTNETIFSLTELPRRLLVLGGGPIGCELAQAFARFGAEVTIVEMGAQFLGREDPDAARVVFEAFGRDGIDVRLDTRVASVQATASEKRVTLESGGQSENLGVDAILVATGRTPNVEGLGLDAVGVESDARGVVVSDQLRTSNPNIYAAGDVCMKYKFTHAADFAARAVIRNALFFGRVKLSDMRVPWCTYTSPEVAHVGLYPREAEAQGIAIDTYTRQFEEVDRAIAEGQEAGFVKVHTRKGKDEILGATIVAPHAGDLISEISVAMAGKLGLGKLSSVIHPYPTQAEAIRQVGDAYNRTRLTPLAKKLFDRLLALRR